MGTSAVQPAMRATLLTKPPTGPGRRVQDLQKLTNCSISCSRVASCSRVQTEGNIRARHGPGQRLKPISAVACQAACTALRDRPRSGWVVPEPGRPFTRRISCRRNCTASRSPRSGSGSGSDRRSGLPRSHTSPGPKPREHRLLPPCVLRRCPDSTRLRVVG